MTGPPLPADQPDRDRLRRHLLDSRISGDVQTPRENNLHNIDRLCAGEEHWTFGLTFARAWRREQVLGVLAERVGVDPDPGHTVGGDRIDPERTLLALDSMRRALAGAAGRGARVLLATGHPAGVLAIHVGLATGLAAAGCQLLAPAPGWAYRTESGAHREIRHVAGVAMVSGGGGLNHTHSPQPMLAMLSALAAAGEPPPDLVVADHGFAGAAAENGIPTVGFADSNDPALFVAAEEGKLAVAVPLDDNVLPHLYLPVTEYLLAGWAPEHATPIRVTASTDSLT